MTKSAIVCIDDERSVLLSLRDQLSRILNQECAIELAQDEAEALSLLEELTEAGTPVPVVLCDQILADTRGHLLLTQIYRRYPQTRTVLLTGLAELDDVVYAVNHAKLYRYLSKPWDEIDLGLTVQAAIQSYFQDQHLGQQNLALREANQQLEVLNTRLEQQVEARTVALRQQTEALRQQASQLKESKEAAEVANRAKSEFLANMSHEIRTPLNAVLGFAEILSSELLTPEHREYLQCIMQGGQSLIAIIDDILDLSRLEANELKLTATEFDLRHVIEALVQLLQPQSIAKGLPIVVMIAPEISGQFVGPVGRLQQVLMNLIANAIKFTATGQITVEVNRVKTHEIAPAETLCFSVQDTGIGIAPRDQARIFQPFTQVDISSTRQYEGTGLGLTICQKIVQLMGGKIQVESALGQGSNFWFTVNLLPSKASAVQVSSPVLTQGSPPSAKAKSAIRILVVEDTPTNQVMLTRMIKPLGYQVDAVSNGQQALEQLAIQPSYDVVLMDCQMPVLDGYETTQQLRQREGADRHTIVIGVTADAMVGDREKCLAAGMDDYLSKPIRMASLRTLLAQWLVQ